MAEGPVMEAVKKAAARDSQPPQGPPLQEAAAHTDAEAAARDAARELNAAVDAFEASDKATVAAERDAAREPRGNTAALEGARGGGGRTGGGSDANVDSIPIRFRFNSAFDSELISIGLDSSPIPIRVRFDPLRS